MKKIEWHIEVRKLSALKEWEKNPRLLMEKGLADLKKSIDKFGLAEPLVINTDGMICGGHGRLKILLQSGVKECDCYVPNRKLTEDEFRELNIRLNANIAGVFDFEVLANEWDSGQLVEWGMDLPNYETETQNAQEPKTDSWFLNIEFQNETECQKLYESLTKKGLICKIVQ